MRSCDLSVGFACRDKEWRSSWTSSSYRSSEVLDNSIFSEETVPLFSIVFRSNHNLKFALNSVACCSASRASRNSLVCVDTRESDEEPREIKGDWELMILPVGNAYWNFDIPSQTR